ncbi:hypothetical protein JIN84_12200 [Luteolibacter yonseiensis]|uniref:Sulfotransferase n=1 Tax=Luteolibacter yonseiensis TaxID=1144680 RepID=A0A934R783_9BACT|nr:hypothetical protein [Luteolibacter yonseiensis]MBK1816379.1 hypothetical protein [Luteolibacter yonseiensis]
MECVQRIRSQVFAPDVLKGKRAIISDENLLGFIVDIVRRKGYHALVKKLVAMRDVLGGEVRVFLTIRSYADFISSMYCELVTTKPYFSFEEIRHGKFVTELSWLRLYRALAKVFGRHNVVIFEYDLLFSQPSEHMCYLAGARIDFEFPGKGIRVSPSAKAVEHIGMLSQDGSAMSVRKMVVEANRKFPKNADNPAFDPWTPEERARLDERYRKHLKRIPRWHPGKARAIDREDE